MMMEFLRKNSFILGLTITVFVPSFVVMYNKIDYAVKQINPDTLIAWQVKEALYYQLYETRNCLDLNTHNSPYDRKSILKCAKIYQAD